MPKQTVNGTTMHYAEAGNGPSLVFVHGFPLDSRMWEKQVGHFATRFRVIAPDLRGFGKSASAEPFTMDSLAADIRTLLQQIDALPCILCGLSMGGYVALAYVKLCPTDLRGLVLIDTRAEADTAEGKVNRNKMIELVRTSGSKAVADQMLPKMLAKGTLESKPDVVRTMRDMMETCPPLTIEHALEALRDREDHLSNLASIAIPTMIVVGEQDVLTPPQMSRVMHENIPRSQLAIIPDAGHMSPLEQPQAVNRELDRFVQSFG
jgi:pimeloyl-ACP methyl ester carboxylesterase